MNGHFSEEALLSFAQLAAQTQSADFAEGDTYDFTRCVRPNGSAYGTQGRCKSGTESPAVEKTPPARSGGSTTFPEAKAREIASALAKKHRDGNFQVEKTEGGFKVSHPYYVDSQVNREVKKYLQKTPAAGQPKPKNPVLSEERAKQIASALAKKHRDNNFRVEKTKDGFKVTHAYYVDSQVNREVKKYL